MVSAARWFLTSVAEIVPQAIRGDILVESGRPARVICDVARDRDASMVVIGAHHHGLVRRVLGTTAARVANEIDRPLVVVRAPAASADEGRPSVALSLRAHMALEEKRLRPAFERANPEDTRALLDEHADLRSLLSTFGVAVDLHALRQPQVDELLDHIRAHSAHIEKELYPWLDSGARAELKNRVAAAGGPGKPGA